MSPSQIVVTGGAAFTLTVDREKAQALLDEAGRSDLILPDAMDGAGNFCGYPILSQRWIWHLPEAQCRWIRSSKVSDVETPGRLYPDCVILVEMPSPTVNAPAGVDVDQLAQTRAGVHRDDP